MQRCREALRTKKHGLPAVRERTSSRNRRSPRPPCFEHFRVVERLAANRGAAAPAKIFALLAEHRRDRGVPGGGKRARKSSFANLSAGNDPAIGGGRADSRILQRRDQLREPARGSRTSESVKTSTSKLAGSASTGGADHKLSRCNPREARQSRCEPASRWRPSRARLFSARDRGSWPA